MCGCSLQQVEVCRTREESCDCSGLIPFALLPVCVQQCMAFVWQRCWLSAWCNPAVNRQFVWWLFAACIYSSHVSAEPADTRVGLCRCLCPRVTRLGCPLVRRGACVGAGACVPSVTVSTKGYAAR